MDGGEFGNNHLKVRGGPGNRLSAESLPLIDTRLLSQSELRALSHCSSLSPVSSASLSASAGGEDDLTLRIDRSVFNESAGSRKQTFLRVRLARHPQPPRPPSPQRQRDDSSREEQSQLASLLGSLFNVDSIQSKAEEDEGEEELEENEGQIHNNSYVYQRPNLDSVQNVLIQGTSGNETRRKRGRPRKIRNPSEETVEASAYATDLEREGPLSLDNICSNLGTESRYSGSGISMESNLGKRKRGRPPKNSRDGFNQPAITWNSEDKEELVNLENRVDFSALDKEELVNLENREAIMVDLSALDKEELVNLVNREGTMVDLSALGNISEDPYGEELRRITVGLKTKEEILGFLEQLNGEWVNTGKKKKVVKACDFGGSLPRGWRLMLSIKKKGSNQWLACRRYLSPDGQQFETCKEVSTYLQSLLEPGSKNQRNALQSENKTLGQPLMANVSLVGNSDSLGSETNQNLETGRPSGEVFEEEKGAENDEIAADRVKNNVVEKDDDKGIPPAEFLNGDKDNDMKKIDDTIVNLEALSKPEDQDKMMKDMLTTTTTEELEEYVSRFP